MAHARQNGKRLGRPRTAAPKAGPVRELYRHGISKAEIARRLHIGRTSVRRILREIREYLDHLERTKYLAPPELDLEGDDLDDETEEEPGLENPVLGAAELLRFSRVRQLLQP